MSRSFAMMALLGITAMAAVSCFDADKVSTLPDIDPLPFNFYSGYLDIPGTEKSLHYFFQESTGTPETDPVLLWLNGGPGCSSVLGAMTENGFIVNRKNDKDGWMTNDYSWNKAANVIYLESPAGVGYSILGNSPHYFSDEQTADTNLQALLAFFRKFPQFSTNEFFISGESYAGIYVPYTAYSIHEHNSKGNSVQKINLQGIVVGNGVTSYDHDNNNTRVKMANTHALVSDATTKRFNEAGCDSSLNIEVHPMTKFMEFHPQILSIKSDECDEINATVDKNLENIDIYNILAICEPTRISGAPCLNYDFLVNYFNREDVKKSLHIPDEAPAWNFCSDMVGENYHSSPKGSIWIYPILKEAGIRALFYSGDIDLAVPYQGSQAWIDSLGWTVKKEWSQYHVNDQVAGYVKEYEGITFVTAKGAGHMVPQDKPAQAFHFLSAFLNNEEI